MNIDINIDEIAINDFKNYKLIDIREANELLSAPSLMACPHVPLSEFPHNIDHFNKQDSYLIFCAKGGRSHHMADILSREGYKALSLNGGVSYLKHYLQEHGLA